MNDKMREAIKAHKAACDVMYQASTALQLVCDHKDADGEFNKYYDFDTDYTRCRYCDEVLWGGSR